MHARLQLTFDNGQVIILAPGFTAAALERLTTENAKMPAIRRLVVLKTLRRAIPSTPVQLRRAPLRP